MSSLADQYENWFKSGNRDLAEFLSNNTFNEEQFRDCVLTDQFLRHQSGEEVDVAEYATQFKRVSKNPALQTELWLEAFGYMEDRGTVSLESRQQFLARIPDSIRAAVADELLSQSIEATLPTEDPPQIPRYRIENEIGRGTFGIVYQAWDEQLARPVAIKVIQSEQSTESLFAEARLAAGLDAPGIISVYDCGVEAGGRSYLVTSLVEGPDLRKWSDSIDRADRNRICGLFVLLCESLAKAHQNGIVHRDIKPTNIIVKETDEPVLLDFGLAIGNWQAGRQGELIGTPAYMSPEQARGEGHLIDARSDIFSVGILLIETLTGKKPWQNRSSRELLREIAHGNAISVRNLDGQIPVELEHICSKATATNMSERFSSISELAEELKWFCAEKIATSDVDGPSGSQPIGPRGLRPYTHDDAAAFWQLLPGHRNGKGVPDSVRWWLEQLQQSEAKGPPRAVLVLYGPSGSGKSSLLHAGVIPFVNANTRCYSVDASELNATVSLAQQIANYVPGAPSGQESLPASMAVIREAANHRTVIVFDQFEQIFCMVGFRATRRSFVGPATGRRRTAAVRPCCSRRVLVRNQSVDARTRYASSRW